MKKIAAMLVLATLSPFCAIANPPPPPMLLDKIDFQVSAKQWVSTQTALLTVAINATLNSADLVKARADIMDHLNRIAKGEWHITQFDRSQDNSGLDKLYVAAQVRVPQANLTNIYQNAKDVSKPGATYTISGVEFKPSLEEIQVVKSQLRQKLYQLVNEEIARLNKVYGEQHYSVNRLYITDGEAPVAQPRAYQAKEAQVMYATSIAAPAIAVSNELTMTAVVEAASNREASHAVASPSH
ncbi:hypothetical protein Lrub_0661 [Legionella rubrilucens]|uniref:DUF541 domain-containing protein n=1 Tax=Legionella rubrilucens TaxID=458 RepID=A0A0W0XYC3_9GAMM|nr:hypothetical protein [Legionella rubrilucens]KTD49562.1 hypothetical protein Lrub_0661 [Legionella rubrilucens]